MAFSAEDLCIEEFVFAIVFLLHCPVVFLSGQLLVEEITMLHLNNVKPIYLVYSILFFFISFFNFPFLF